MQCIGAYWPHILSSISYETRGAPEDRQMYNRLISTSVQDSVYSNGQAGESNCTGSYFSSDSSRASVSIESRLLSMLDLVLPLVLSNLAPPVVYIHQGEQG